MHRILVISLFLFLPYVTHAQFEYFNSEAFWRKFVLHKQGEKFTYNAADTVILVASNRVMDTSTFRFLPELRDGKTVHYFLVYSDQGQWHVQPVDGLREGVQCLKGNNRDWVVYTEGMGKFFTSDVERGMHLSAQYGVNVLLLDYPSITTQRKRLGNYYFAKQNAAIAHKDFIYVLDTLKELRLQWQLGTGSVNLFFHSMGNIMMRQIVKNDKLGQINDAVWVDNLILNAPCVPARGHKKWVDKISFAKRTYIHYNPKDFTLGGAYLLSKRHQLGMKVRKSISDKATYINFNSLVDKGHSNFLNLKGRNKIPDAAYNHYNILFHGKGLPLEDTTLYQPSAYKNIGFDILPSESKDVVNHH